MSRGPRIDFPGAFHHVCARGIEKRDIVNDDRDRQELHRRVYLNLQRAKASCLAWAFLPNHFHLLFYSENGVLSLFMHRLMSGYSLYFNRRHQRVGHLFQNRFRSSVIRTEKYLREAIRYIHLNPLRAGLVCTLDGLSRYPWTMHREILRSEGYPWAEFPRLGDFFGGDGGKTAIMNYLEFLEDGLRTDPTVSISYHPGQGETIFPSGSGTASASEEQGESHDEFSRVVSKACREAGISVDQFRTGRRDRISSIVRTEVLKQCVAMRGMKRRQVSSWLGITDAGGAYLLRTAEKRGAHSPLPGGIANELPSGMIPDPAVSRA
jgi:putative transposase